MAVFEAGQGAGSAPELVARIIVRIIGTPAPARYYLVAPEKWYARLARILPRRPSRRRSATGSGSRHRETRCKRRVSRAGTAPRDTDHALLA